MLGFRQIRGALKLLKRYRFAAAFLVFLLVFFFSWEYAGKPAHLGELSFLKEQVAAMRAPENALLPDIAPLPPRDFTIEHRGETMLLRFSTTYYNQGRGPLELRADSATANIRDDIERDVFQRVYQEEPETETNEEYKNSKVGTFLWHQEHVHYHFSDFIDYTLARINEDGAQIDADTVTTKATFCIRDVSRVELELPARAEEAAYRICGKDLQGISVGWADTYFADYPDQSVDITNLSSGMYRLTFTVNPEHVWEELDFHNNVSWVLIALDMEHGTVSVLEEYPASPPPVEHIHLEQPFGLPAASAAQAGIGAPADTSEDEGDDSSGAEFPSGSENIKGQEQTAL